MDPDARRLCLDFANGVSGEGTAGSGPGLGRYADLVAWVREARLVSPSQARALEQGARRAPSAASRAFRQARALGEAIGGVLSASVGRRPPRPIDLAVINHALGRGRGRVVRRGAGMIWEWVDDGSALDRLLAAVARSAAQVVTSSDVARVRRCAAAECGRLFLDATRNQTRRWCDMAVCGNRAKARRFYARRLRGGGAGRDGRSARGRREGSRSRRAARARPRS